jgi:hypothetical protein
MPPKRSDLVAGKRRKTPRCRSVKILEHWPHRTRCYEQPKHDPPHNSAHGIRWLDGDPGVTTVDELQAGRGVDQKV